jgi:hypothetical protein
MCVTPIARLGTSVSGSAATVCAYTDVGMVYCVSCEIQTSLKFRRYACLNKPLDDPSQVAMLDRYASIQCCLVSLYLDALYPRVRAKLQLLEHFSEQPIDTFPEHHPNASRTYKTDDNCPGLVLW